MTKKWFPWWISYFQALHLLNRLFSGQTMVMGSFTWNDLCWVVVFYHQKKTNDPTWGSSLFTHNTTNWIRLFLSLLHLIPLLMSHLGARSWLWPNNLKNKFYNNSVAFFPPIVSYRSLYCCFKNVRSYQEVMVARSSLVCRDCAVFCRSRELKPGGCRGVSVCTVIHFKIKSFVFDWL